MLLKTVIRYRAFLITFIVASSFFVLPSTFDNDGKGQWEVGESPLAVDAPYDKLDQVVEVGNLRALARSVGIEHADVLGIALVDTKNCATIYADANDFLELEQDVPGIKFMSVVMDLMTTDDLNVFEHQIEWTIPTTIKALATEVTDDLVNKSEASSLGHIVFVSMADGRILEKRLLSSNVAPRQAKLRLIQDLVKP